MFHITNPVRTPVNTGPQTQPKAARPTNELRFGMKTVSFGHMAPQEAQKIAPTKPVPAQPKTQGARLDYYA